MDKLIINGGRKLKGTARVSGAKNAALPCMAAAILAGGEHRLDNIPQVADTRTMARLLNHIGITTERRGTTYALKHLNTYAPVAPYDIVKTMRASSLVLGPMLAMFGEARVSLPGGCTIGARPMNLHLKALEAMGAEVSIEEGYINARAKRLRGAVIHFDNVTVTGTENIMMAATLANGATILENAAREPEVGDLAAYLVKMGAHIEGAGTDKITIEGVDALHAAQHTIIADRIEAGTLACAAAITGGDVTIEGCPAEFIEALLAKLKEAGCIVDLNPPQPPLEWGGKGKFDAPRFTVHSLHILKSTNISTSPFPGFATDLQAQIMACMTLAEGTSVITENIFENRFMHVQELTRLGADIKIEGHAAIVKGVGHLAGAPVMATDLRASASLVLAGLAAKGTTEIQRIYHLDRGYEQLDKKLVALGADIIRSTY